MKGPVCTLAVALCSLAVTAVGQDSWIERATVEYPSGNLHLSTRWDPEAGLHLRLSHTNSARSVLIDLTGKRVDIKFEPQSAFSPVVRQSPQVNPAALPQQAMDSVSVTLKVRPEVWMVYLEDRPVAAFAVPFSTPVTVSHPSAELPLAKDVDVFFQKTGNFLFADAFMVPQPEEGEEDSEEETEEVPVLAEWEIESGTWELHTVIDDALDRQYLKDESRKKPIMARSPNFYSLRASGTNGLITTGYDFYDWYSLEAAVHISDGEMGLVFNRHEKGYYAFTITRHADSPEEALLQLWSRTDDAGESRKVLGAATVQLVSGQWIKLKVRTFLNRVHCYMDHTRVIDVSTELPAGGRFGLFVNASSSMRFDDVRAASNHDLDFAGPEDLQRHLIAMDGTPLKLRSGIPLVGGARKSIDMTVPKASAGQSLIIGSAEHGGQVFAANFSPKGDAAEVGLIAGYRSAQDPYYRFVYRRDGARDSFKLEHVSTNATDVLEELTLDGAPGRDAVFALMQDATEEGVLRMYRDGQLVLVHHPADPVQGAAGIYIASGTEVNVRDPLYKFQRPDVYRNEFEKNRQFIEDPFMRHWSSPEGQWIALTNEITWYKGDFFGRFLVRLPYLTNTTVHLGVPEGTTDGAVVVKADDTGLTLSLNSNGQEKPFASISTNDLAYVGDGAAETNTAPCWYSIHYEGFWVWLTSGDRVLAKQQLSAPLTGTRVRIGGFSPEQLTHSYVERFNVRDFLFTESLHEWTINGGRWEVINRFDCLPEWSHMNGESKDNLAALWSKYRFKGDFCMEMYAGIRHGWYERCGDINLTIMNRTMSPGDGYTVTCTGWDIDESQLHTTFYRNGEILAQSDKYLVPRRRDNNLRRGYNPLVHAGRDVHGAWYYIKLRRIGTKLQYWFDNELVFECEDPKQIEMGSAGIWTFMNSMMIARVKIAAERVEPKLAAFTPLSAQAAAQARKPAPPPEPGPAASLTKDGVPLQTTAPSWWEPDDSVGHAQTTWHRDAKEIMYFASETLLGSGGFLTRASLPLVPLDGLAGWRFEIKRTANAHLNFLYSVGLRDADGVYVPSRFFFHHISGAAFPESAYRMSGNTPVPPSPQSGPGWHTKGTWTTVYAWADRSVWSSAPDPKTTLVRIEGFGNLQPSEILQGLKGNAPGEAYAVRDFTEVRYGTPQLGTGSEPPEAAAYELSPAASQNVLHKNSDLGELQKWVEQASTAGLQERTLTVTAGGKRSVVPLAWIHLPETPAVACTWSPDVIDAFVLRCSSPYPDPRFAYAQVSLDELNVPIGRRTTKEHLVYIPKRESFSSKSAGEIPVHVSMGDQKRTFALDLTKRTRAGPPALLALEGLTPLFETFESQELPKTLVADATTMELGYSDETQGTYLDVHNSGKAARLATTFQVANGLPIAEYPLMQLRYRATGMAHLSLGFDSRVYARISENYEAAKEVREADEFQLDGKWHTWQGFVSDAIGENRLHNRLLTAHRLTFGSRDKNDQTGLYSRWHVDDVVVGPAVSGATGLKFAPHYFSFDNVAQVKMALHGASQPYDSLADTDLAKVTWRAITNNAETSCDIKELPEGICHLFLKAVDTKGRESPVTDIPLLVDRTPPSAKCAYEASDDPDSNGTKLRMTVETHGLAPLDLANVALAWEDTKMPMNAYGSLHTHAPESDSLLLNWPYMFRRYIDQTKDGETYTIAITGIRDGAGNATKDLTIPCRIDYASDKHPPTLMRPRFPTNVLWTTCSEPTANIAQYMRVIRGVEAKTMYEENGEPYIRVTMASDPSTISRAFARPAWTIAAHPYVAFRIRQPSADPKSPPRIDLVLDMQGKDTDPLLIALDHKESGENRVYLDPPIRLHTNEWQSVVIDLRKVLDGKLTEKKMFKQQVSSLGFRATNVKNKLELDVQSIFVFADWTSADTVTVNAYDASGMDGIVWGRESRTSDMSLSPVGVLTGDRDTGWFVVRARDRAGNLSAPIRFPVFDIMSMMTAIQGGT